MNAAVAEDMSPYLDTPVDLPSPIDGVTAEKWTKFVRVMLTAPIGSVSPSNALGAFQMTTRRLQDLGVLKDIKRTKSKKSGRTIWACTTREDHDRAKKFLNSLSLQFKVFTRSILDYTEKLSHGKIPEGCTLSGALAVANRAGIAGISGERFPETQRAYENANGIF